MKKPLIVLGVVVVFAALWYLASPLFINKEVDEAFPQGMPSMEALMEMSEEEREAIKDDVLEMSAQLPPTEMDEASPADDTTVESAGPTVLLEGQFTDQDVIHRGSGTARVYELEDGSRTLRFEDFEVTNGPGLRVFLSAHPSPDNQSETKDGGYLDLGDLKGNKGNQNYELPEDIDLSLYQSIVIYCYPFNVVFSTATLK